MLFGASPPSLARKMWLIGGWWERFFYEGRKVLDDDTPESLELEDGEQGFARDLGRGCSGGTLYCLCEIIGDAIEVQLERTLPLSLPLFYGY